MRLPLSQKIINWFCDKVWTVIDSQQQIFTIQLDITNACNLRCVHCYCAHHKNEGALNYQQWCAVLDQYEKLLIKLHMLPRIVICGGEPLLCTFLFPLLTEIRRRFPNSEIYLLSNGTLLTQDIAYNLSQCGIKLQISLDGPMLHVMI